MTRAFLIQMPHAELEELCSAIGKPAAMRAELARRLATEALPHLRRLAASERVIAGVEGPLPDAWLFAAECLPYLSSATRAPDILERLARVEQLDREDDLERWFVDEAAALGVVPAKLSRAKYRAPSAEEIASWCAALLDRLADLRAQVIGWSGTPQQRTDYAVTTWVYLAWIFGRLRPTFGHGRSRSLGAATVRVARGTDGTAAMTKAGVFARLLGRAQPRGGDDHAMIAGLRDLMISTADLVPSLGMGSQRDSLPIRGSAGIASGAVPLAQLPQLVTLFETCPVPDDWRELVLAAAGAAQRASAHLVEADDRETHLRARRVATPATQRSSPF